MLSLTRVVSVLSVALTAAGCASTPPYSVSGSAADEIRARSHAIAAAEARKDIETALTFWEENAVVHFEGTPAVVGKAGLRAVYQQFFASGFLEFTPAITSVEVARSGDLAYETGVNNITYDRGGQRVVDVSKYLAVWRRGAGGEWKLAALAVTNDQATR